MIHTPTPVLDIRNLRVEYPLANGETLAAVNDINLTIAPGEIHALVGESGAGKTTVGNALMGLLQSPGRIAAGSITIAGKPIDVRTGRTEGIVPGRDVGAIFQDPMTSLNPLFTVESQLCEGMLTHLKISRREARARALDLMKAVGIPEPERRLGSYPHQLSGGQRQRVVIATAHHTADLLFQRAYHRLFRPRMVVVIDRGTRTAKLLGRGRHAALELIIIVAVEQIVLAIVLVLHDRLDRAQSFLENAALGSSFLAGTIGITAPDEIGFGQIRAPFPSLLIDDCCSPA